MSNTKIWTPAEKAELEKMVRSGKNNSVIAEHFGVPLEKIHAIRSRMGLTAAKLGQKPAVKGATKKPKSTLAKPPIPKQVAPLTAAVAKKKAITANKAFCVPEIHCSKDRNGEVYLCISATGKSMVDVAKAIEDAATEVQWRAADSK